MDNEGFTKPGSESQDSDDLAPPGVPKSEIDKSTINIPIPPIPNPNSPATPIGFKLKPSTKGVENAKKRLRAFSIQKKTPITPVTVSKPSGSGNTTVFIGKLSGVKLTPKVDDGEQKKLLPKPPKPGQNKKCLQDSYTELQRRTLSEIEDMKRKMELVELGIPLGLICPTSTNEKAMPTKAMPPIKSFLDPAKLDEIITEAKKARAEGREFKFDYQRLLPDYDNPFQRKKDEFEIVKKLEDKGPYKKSDKDKRKSDRYDRDRRHSHRKDDKRKDDRDKHRDKSKDKEDKKEVKKEVKKAEKETDVNLSDYLVCDSWSLDNEDKATISSPKKEEPAPIEDKKTPIIKEVHKEIEIAPIILDKEPVIPIDSPKVTPIPKMKKLQPVIDSFRFEIDPNEDEILDIFDENMELEKFAKVKHKKDDYDTYEKIFDFDSSKDVSNDALADDTFLESVINEIKQEGMSDEDGAMAQDKGLVEYDSPSRESSSPKDTRLSITPELDDRMRDLQSSRSDYSDGYRSIESGYKSTESGYKSNTSYKSDSRSDRYRLSMEKEEPQMPKSTVASLETWSFVLKVCQPLLFKHDKGRCFRETRTLPKISFAVNTRRCQCIKDRAVVYQELETCKMNLVDRVYGCDQIQDPSEFPKARAWYPRCSQWMGDPSAVPTVAPSTDWEADDSQSETPVTKDKNYKNRSTTPVRNEEIYLDREYQKFMEAVWPEASDKAGTPRSTTPVKQDVRKKKAEDSQPEDKKKAKKIKLSSEGWSQESDVDDEQEKTKKIEKISKVEKVKPRKRKHSSSSVSESDSEKKRRKTNKKKANKKAKSKLTKRRRISKKYLKKLKDKQKKKKKQESDDEEYDKENKKKEKKIKKKKIQKKKKAQKKKKVKSKSSSSSSSSSTSESSSDSESDDQRKKKKKKSDVKKKKRKQSSSDSTQSEELFDVNVLNNIKTERLTDDEKKLEFSPRRQKPREIINVKELQNDFVGSVQVKQEAEESTEKESVRDVEELQEEKEFATESVVECNSESTSQSVSENYTEGVTEILVENIPIPKDEPFKEPKDVHRSTPQEKPAPPQPEATQPEESNLSQCSSQDSTTSKDPYEKDDSHLRPSSQNSNYSFNDVISASQNYSKDDDPEEGYEGGNYEMYEQLAMAYQSDVAKQVGGTSGAGEWWGSQRIETVVRARARGEIKCDWRAGDSPAQAPPAATSHRQRPSRWGLKPGEVNIVLTGGNTEQYPIQNVVEPVYQIQSLANNRSEQNSSTGSYDEAYEDMYGASDRLQYGDCFAAEPGHGRATQAGDVTQDIPLPGERKPLSMSSLDERISQALRTTVLGEVAKDSEETDADKDGPEKGILLTKSEARGAKRVSFADGYKPGQDSDVEEPPKKKKKTRRFGCAWPCPATHPDHVPLWDALPPPPPPPGSPPPSFGQQPPATMIQQPMLLQQPPPMLQQQQLMQQQQMMQQQGINPAMLQTPPFAIGQKMDPSGASLPNFMPPEPPPGLISFQ
ncbi:uncharacterized protein LOC142983841 [Anticarsia gemmatalis]|uniref:uncharacterized protein LOC142983841 n=1 Tax=Anticarsia gemmatalis TaxID=129554 RepID=UPI003F765EE1